MAVGVEIDLLEADLRTMQEKMDKKLMELNAVSETAQRDTQVPVTVAVSTQNVTGAPTRSGHSLAQTCVQSPPGYPPSAMHTALAYPHSPTSAHGPPMNESPATPPSIAPQRARPAPRASWVSSETTPCS